MKAGFYEISADDYHADKIGDEPTLSASIAQRLVTRSPWHAWTHHPRLGGAKRKRVKAPTKEMDRGTIVHALLLGKSRDVVLVDANDWRTDKAKGEREAARKLGKIAVLPKELREANDIVQAIRPQLDERDIRLNGQSELCAVWQEQADDGTPVWCRALFDHLLINTARIWDLKTSGKPMPPDKLDSKVDDDAGYIQAVAYPSALAAIRPELAGRATFGWIFAECGEEPYAVVTGEPDGAMREMGILHWRRAINMWAQCMRTGEWPGYPLTPVRVGVKPWRLQQAQMESEDEGEAA
jgi:hypothetical protein